MSLTEKFAQLDGEIRDLFEKTLQEHREGLKQRLREGQEELLRSLEEAPPALPEGLVDPASLTAAVKGESRSEAQRAFLATLRRFDRCQSQTEVLQVLLEESGAFAARRAIFLTRSEEATGWSGAGWSDDDGSGETMRGVSIPFDADDGWARLRDSGGTIALGSARCAALCSRLEAPVPQEGVIVPLVLRDRIAAALYADRPSDDDSFDIPGLQALVYLAAQSIETLAFRDRPSTPSLWLQGESPEEQPALALWDSSAPATPPAPTTPAQPAQEESQATEEPATEQPATEEPATGTPESIDADASESAAASVQETGFQTTDIPTPPPTAPPEPEEPEPAVEESAAEEGDASGDSGPALEELQEMELADADSSFWSMPQEVADQTLIGHSQIGDGSIGRAQIEEAQAEDQGASPEDLFEEDEVPAEPPPISSTLELGNVDLEAVREEHEQAATQADEGEAVDAPTEEAVAEPAPTGGEVGQETVMIDRSRFAGTFGDPPPAAAAPPEDPRESTLSSGAQVVPPQDVDGPGWAFASLDSASANEAAGDAEHEEARRLARLLVSEIRLYNEEQVEEGRRHGDIYRRLKDDIDRSRQMYRERVSQTIADSSDYFQQELVRILGAGDANALGM
ncbi:MAG: hypothetical protein AAF481_14035 [Acidobacteriota bacterium]